MQSSRLVSLAALSVNRHQQRLSLVRFIHPKQLSYACPSLFASVRVRPGCLACPLYWTLLLLLLPPLSAIINISICLSALFACLVSVSERLENFVVLWRRRRRRRRLAKISTFERRVNDQVRACVNTTEAAAAHNSSEQQPPESVRAILVSFRFVVDWPTTTTTSQPVS